MNASCLQSSAGGAHCSGGRSPAPRSRLGPAPLRPGNLALSAGTGGSTDRRWWLCSVKAGEAAPQLPPHMDVAPRRLLLVRDRRCRYGRIVSGQPARGSCVTPPTRCRECGGLPARLPDGEDRRCCRSPAAAPNGSRRCDSVGSSPAWSSTVSPHPSGGCRRRLPRSLGRHRLRTQRTGRTFYTANGADGIKWGRDHSWDGQQVDTQLTIATYLPSRYDDPIDACRAAPGVREVAHWDQLTSTERDRLKGLQIEVFEKRGRIAGQDRRELDDLSSRAWRIAVFAGQLDCGKIR